MKKTYQLVAGALLIGIMLGALWMRRGTVIIAEASSAPPTP